jgi:DNA repair photolyase
VHGTDRVFLPGGSATTTAGTVTLRTHLLQLLAPFRPGDEVVRGAHLVGVLLEIGLGWRFRTEEGDVNVEVSLAADTERFAARTPRLALSYRAITATPASSHARKALCEALVPIVARNEDAVLAAIERDAADDAASRGGGRVREVQVDTALEPALDSPLPLFTLTPYVGCVIGCRFCYAQAPIGHMRRLAGAPVVPWGSYVDVRVNLPEVLARELVDAPRWPIKFCPILSDPYQAVESRYEVTRSCLKVLRAAAPRPVCVLTRSRLVERDAELLASLPAWVGASIPTFDDDVRRHFEPRAAPIADRFALLRMLRAAGVETFAVVQPLLPGPVAEFADALAECVSSVSIDVLHDVHGAVADFADTSYTAAATDDWQRERAAALTAALVRNGVAIWDGDLPPSLSAPPA